MMREKNSSLLKCLFFVESIHKSYINEYGANVNNIYYKRKQSIVLTENGRFISPKLKQMINSIEYDHLDTNFVIKDVHIKVDIYKPQLYDNENIKVNNIIEAIKFISYFSKTVNQSFKDNVEIKVILSPFKKEISENNHLTSYNVNSGFTIRDYYKGESKIVIFREEEVIKVLIHELLHSFDLDSKSVRDRYDIRFSKLFEKETEINLNESFTESFACLLNVCLASIYISRKNKVSLSGVFRKVLDHERRYILSVGERVGRYNMTNRREQTNITSYYVLKAINWKKIEDFVDYVIKHNYTIGSYREYTLYLGAKINENIHEIKEMRFAGESKESMKNDMSIRMSSIDILNI